MTTYGTASNYESIPGGKDYYTRNKIYTGVSNDYLYTKNAFIKAERINIVPMYLGKAGPDGSPVNIPEGLINAMDEHMKILVSAMANREVRILPPVFKGNWTKGVSPYEDFPSESAVNAISEIKSTEGFTIFLDVNFFRSGEKVSPYSTAVKADLWTESDLTTIFTAPYILSVSLYTRIEEMGILSNPSANDKVLPWTVMSTEFNGNPEKAEQLSQLAKAAVYNLNNLNSKWIMSLGM